MDDLQGIDVEKIVQQIQEKVRQSQPRTPSTALTHPSNGQLTADLAALHNYGDPFRIKFSSHRKVLGRLIILAKEALRRVLTPILEQQLAYNATNTRMLSQLWEQLKEVQGEITKLGAKVNAIGAQEVALRGEVEAVGQRQDAALRGLREAVVQQLEVLEQQHIQICQALRQGVMEQLAVLGQQMQDRIAQPQEHPLPHDSRISPEMDETGRRLSTPWAPHKKTT